MKQKYIRLMSLILILVSVVSGLAQDSTGSVFHDLEQITINNVDQLGVLATISLENDIQNSVFEVEFDSTANLLAYVTLNETGLFGLEANKILWRIPAHQGTNVAFSSDGHLMVASNYPETYLWRDLSDSGSWEELVRNNTSGPGDVGDIRFSEDQREIIAVTKQNYGIFRWQVATGELLFEAFEAAADERTMIDDAILSRDGHVAAIFGRKGSVVEFVETTNGDVLSEIAIDEYFVERTEAPLSVSFLSFTLDNHHVLLAASASDLLSSSVLSLNSKGEIDMEIQYDYEALWTSGAINSDETILVLANAVDGAIYFFNFATYEQLARVESGQEGITTLTFSADGELLASGSYDGTVRLWGVPAGE